MSKSYWDYSGGKKRNDGPKLNFFVIFLIIIFTFALCLGTYLLIQNWDELNIGKEITRGTSQTGDVYFQNTEVRNKYYDMIPGIVANNMKKINW